MIKLRNYQEQLVQKIRAEIKNGHTKVLLQLPTGGGKTVIFTYIAKNAMERGNKVLVITDRQELQGQGARTFKELGVEPMLLTAQTKRLTDAGIYIAMSETIKRRIENPDYLDFVRSFDIVIVDEVHKQSFDRIYKYLTDSQFLLGVTATPYRLAPMTPLAEHFTSIIQGNQINELIQLGYLSDVTHYGVSIPEVDKIKLKGGEFDPKQTEQLYGEKRIYTGVIDNLNRISPSGKVLLFSATVAGSQKITHELNAAGIRAMHLDGETPKETRRQILADFKEGKFRVLCNVGVLTTGYDEASIDTVVLYRPTQSLPLFLQMCGRGSRIADGKKHFKILDFGENVKRHGYWDENRTWTLDLAKKPKKKGLDQTKICPSCGAIIKSGFRECPECGYKFLTMKNKKGIEVKVELVELTNKQIEVGNWSVAELEQIRKAKGYAQGWLLRKLGSYTRFQEYAELMGYAPGWVYINANRYL